MPTPPYDNMTIDEIANKAQEASVEASQRFAAHEQTRGEHKEREAIFWLAILQARAALEAAEVQKRAIELQTEKTASLVRGTWWLARSTIVLAIAPSSPSS